MLSRQLSATEFRQAYTLLFEKSGSVRDCIIHVRGLDQRSLKKVYRRKAHATHPDRAHLQPIPAANPDEEFRAVVAAYELLRLVQQGDVEVALVTSGSSGAAGGAQRPRPRPSSRPHPAGERRSASAGREQRSHSSEDRRRAREQRRDHRNDQPFSAGAHYARWQGRAAESATEGDGDWAARWREATRRSRFNSESSHYVDTPVPRRVLQIGQFLYYSGAVSWRQLIDALVWQRQQRPLIGQLALAWGLLTREQIHEVLRRRRQCGRYEVPFAEFAMECGYLTASQHRSLCARASQRQLRLGRYFVEQGILNEEQLAEQLRAMRLHNWRVKRRAQSHG